MLIDNARGEYSKSELYRQLPTFVAFHYQCSRKSTSNQIAEVFERAIERQTRAKQEGANILCFVFMDEAGLPEEGRESLKVLHYYLKSSMNVQTAVGFVAISNHVLDAAKTNRCNLLMRNPPDHNELFDITVGCFQMTVDPSQCICYVTSEENSTSEYATIISSKTAHLFGLFDHLCESFESCVAGSDHPKTKVTKIVEFIEFFGLRVYMYAIKLLGRLASNCRTVNKAMLKDALESISMDHLKG